MLKQTWLRLKRTALTVFLFFYAAFSFAYTDKPSLDRLTDDSFTVFITHAEDLQSKQLQEALILLKRYSNDIELLSIDHQVKYYQVLAENYLDQSQFQISQSTATTGLQLAKKTIPSTTTTELFYIRGFTFESLGDLESAVANYSSGLEIAQSLEEAKFIANGLINLGAIYYQTENFKQSLIYLNEALIIANQLTDEELKGFVNTELGILYAYMEKREKAIEFYQASYQHYKNAGKEIYALHSLRNIAINHMENGRYEEAITLFEKLLASSDKINNKAVMGNIYTLMAKSNIHKKEPDNDAAYHYLNLAEQFLIDAQHHDSPLLFTVDKAIILKALKRYDEALESLDKAEGLLSDDVKIQNTYSHFNIYILKASIFFKTEKYQQAYKKQGEFFDYLLAERERNDMAAVEELSMRLESEQADLQKKLLQQQQAVHALELKEVNFQTRNRQIIIVAMAIFSLLLIWFLIKLIHSHKKLLWVTKTDILVGAINQKKLYEIGEQALVTANKEHKTLSVISVSIDNFKDIQNSCGTKVAESTLRTIAMLGQETMRLSDTFGRCSNDELVAIFPDTSREQAIEIAARLSEAIEKQQWSHKHISQITISLGVASSSKQSAQSFEQLFNSVEVIQYQANLPDESKVCRV